MKHSETFAKLGAALVAAQAQIKGVAKNSTNPHFKTKYASLDDIVAAIRPVLASHKLAIVQGACDPIVDHGGSLEGFSVETMLIHESGEWIANAAIVPLTKVDAQGAGGAMTYGRRYGLSALLSLATDEDDDGNVAATPRRAAKPPLEKPPLATSEQKARIAELLNNSAIDLDDSMRNKTASKAGRLDFTKDEATRCAAWLESLIPAVQKSAL